MKFNDNFSNAEVTLKETMTLIKQLQEVQIALKSFQERKVEEPSIKFPVYMRESVQSLMNAVIRDFGVQYPNLQLHFENGDGEDNVATRLSSAILTISSLMSELKEMHYLVRSDDSREHLKSLAYNSIQHLLVFLYLQYKLERFPIDEYLPLFTYCEKEEMLVEEFIEEIKKLQEEFKAYPNIYEVHSEVADTFLSIEYDTCTKAEEIGYPLTEEIATKALESAEAMKALKAEIEAAVKNNITTDTETSHKEVLRKMRLG